MNSASDTKSAPPTPSRGLVGVGAVDGLLRTLATLARRRWRALAVAIFVTITGLVTAIAATTSDLNWDILAYTAIIYEDETESAEELHTLAYDMIRPHADERQWHHLIKGYWYFERMSENPDGFVSQFGMYRVKAFYIEVLALLSNAMDTVTAAKVINAFAIALAALAVFLYMRKEGALDALPIMAAAMLAAGYITAAVSPQPDALAIGISLSGMLLFAGGRPWLAVPVLILAATTRPDNAIVLFAVLLASLAYGYGRLPALVGFAAGMATVLLVTSDADHPGWWAHFYFSVIAQQEYMDSFDPPFEPLLYLRILVEHAALAFYGNAWAAVMMLVLCAWAVMAARGTRIPTPGKTILLAAILAVLGKFVVFPLSLDRIYFAQTIAAVTVLVAAARPTIALPRYAPSAGASPD